MTAPAVLQINMIKALIEAIDVNDEEDAKQALKMLKGLIGEKPAVEKA